jgi:hypothetical protein
VATTNTQQVPTATGTVFQPAFKRVAQQDRHDDTFAAIATLMAPQEGDEICDPTCGSGSLLMKCGRLIRENTGSRKYALSTGKRPLAAPGPWPR